jgi:sulfite reductase (NADPH) flavoprotein alpha-component
MKRASIKSVLFKLHRWIGIGLAPLFLAIAVSGAVLALKPIQTPDTASSGTAVSVQQLADLLTAIDPLGDKIEAARVDTETGLVHVQSQHPQLGGVFDPANSEPVSSTTQEDSFDLFETAEHLHKELLVGADLLVQLASYLMLLILLTAPFLARPVLRNNLTGWHRGLGWLLLPLTLMLPLTGVLMSQHLGMPELPRMSQPEARLSLQQALARVDATEDSSQVRSLRRFHGGSVMLRLQSGNEERLLLVTDQSVTSINPDDNLVKTLHEGSWAGSWSGVLNLLGATALALLTLTGPLSWLKRRRKRLQLQAKRATAQAVA